MAVPTEKGKTMTEFITRNYGNESFEVIIKTDSKEHYKATQDFARRLIDHAKHMTIQRWIPVTERLPEIPDGWAENPEPVLYMMASTRKIRAGYYGEGGTYRDKYFREYYDSHEGVDADDVLCWMWQQDLPQPPLPEAPKGE